MQKINKVILRLHAGKIFLPFLLFVITVNLFSQTASSYTSNPNYIETMSVTEKVASTNNYVGNLNEDSLTTLPFGIIKEIGTTRYVIAIDSAVFQPNVARYHAYMAIDFPGSSEKIAFIAKNIAFNPKGVIPGNNTRLVLASDQKINIGPKISLSIKADGNNYIEWDCNGFKAINLKGNFEFHNSMLKPDTSRTKDSTVTASFSIYTNDIHNFITQVSITPFCIKGLNDVTFSVTDATVDMSEVSNATGMTFPQGYSGSSIGSNINMWTGFYLKQFKIKLPKEISKNNKATEIFANNFFIDKSGVTGNFQATNLFSTSESTMSGWGFSLDQLVLNFVSNNLNGGNMAGKVMLPLNNLDGVAYNASIYQNPVTEQTDFSISVSPVNSYTAHVLSATIDIYPTTKITVQKINGTFKPSATLNGKITFSHSDMKSPTLEMQNVVLVTDAPYLKSGVFSFTNGSSSDLSSGNLGGFTISFNSISVLVNSSSPGIGFNAGISFTAKDDAGFGTSATFNVLTKQIPNANPSFSPQWKFDKILVNDIGLSVHTSAVKIDGLIKYNNNSPVYGKGFFGSITLFIEGFTSTPATANAWFGSKNNFNYFYLDVAVPYTYIIMRPSPPECPQGFAIYRFMGGLYYKMRPSAPVNPSQLYTAAFGSAQNYVPDSTMSMGLKGGVTMGTYPNSSIVNGDVAMEINFTSAGGMNEIKFSGNAFLFVKLSERVPTPKVTTPVKLALNMTYNFQTKVLETVTGVDINLPSVKAHGQGELHIDSTTWYCYFGKPDCRVNAYVLNVATLSSYLMLGNKIEGVPAPPDQVGRAFGHGFADTRNPAKLSNGDGFALGASLNAGKSGGFNLSDFSVYYNLSFAAGFDLMALDYGSKAHCSGSTAPAGFNGWYANGNVYAALSGIVGARGKYLDRDFDVQLLSISAAALLAGKFPNPGYVSGNIAVNYNFLRVFRGSFNFNFELGDNCNVVM
ncbi:MAG: hypothetical protein ACXVPN_06010 [Bacteroidia bacterium]